MTAWIDLIAFLALVASGFLGVRTQTLEPGCPMIHARAGCSQPVRPAPSPQSD